jgi:mycothiol synthase
MSVLTTLREPTIDDAEAILEVWVRHDLAAIGEPTVTIEEVRTSLATASMHEAVIDDPAGGLLGHVWVDYVDGHTKTWADFALRPGADQVHAQAMLDWLIDTARALGPGLPIHTFCDSKNTAKQEMLEQAGGRVVRRFIRMGISLDAPPVVPDVPAGVAIRLVGETDADLRALHTVVDTAFLDHFGHETESFETWLEHLNAVSPDPGLRWLATVDGEPVAGLYGVQPSESLGYLDALGTLREFRGRGLGRALLLTSFAEFYRRGLRRAALGVDATNPTGALELYQSVGMQAEHNGMRYELR